MKRGYIITVRSNSNRLPEKCFRTISPGYSLLEFLIDSTKTPWYGASKAASNYLIKYYAAKFFGKLILNSIILGGVKKGNENTEFLEEYSKNFPNKSMLNITEVTKYISSLLSNPMPSLSSGSEIIIDGGWLLW